MIASKLASIGKVPGFCYLSSGFGVRRRSMKHRPREIPPRVGWKVVIKTATLQFEQEERRALASRKRLT
jgi:hypothetical protein